MKNSDIKLLTEVVKIFNEEMEKMEEHKNHKLIESSSISIKYILKNEPVLNLLLIQAVNPEFCDYFL